jgi:hypothetical protein
MHHADTYISKEIQITDVFEENVSDFESTDSGIKKTGSDVIDEFGYENLSERWNPSQSVNSIIISIISMIISPNLDSPANVDASKLWKNNYDEYSRIIYKMVDKSSIDILTIHHSARAFNPF